MTFKERTERICPRIHLRANQWQKHYTNLKLLLQQSVAHKINVEILKEKYKKFSVLLQQLTFEINDKINLVPRVFRLPTRRSGRSLNQGLSSTTPSCGKTKDPGNEVVIIYTSYNNLRNLLRQLLSCKISYKMQLKNLKYLPPQSPACEVYRKQ